MGISKRRDLSSINLDNVSEAAYTSNTDVLYVKENSEYYIVTKDGEDIPRDPPHELKFDNDSHDDVLQDLRDLAED